MRIGYDAKKMVRNFTGIGNYSRDAVNALSAHYPESSFHLYATQRRVPEALQRISRADNIVFHQPCNKPCSSFYDEWWRCFGMVKDWNKEQIDLFHGLSNELPFGLQRARCKTVVTIHDLIFLRFPQVFDLTSRTILKIKTRYACRHADRIIAVSEQTKRDIVSFYNIAEDKIDVVYQGCNDIYFDEVTPDMVQEVVNTYHLPASYILSVGTFEHRKNQVGIVKALPFVDPSVHLVLVGKPSAYQKEVESEINRLGLSHRVTILNNVPNTHLPALYKGSMLSVYLSYFEGFGIPVLESLAVGVPVIAATGSCLEEAGGKHSLYCSPFAPQELANCIEQVRTNPQLAETMVAKGKEYAQHFSKENIAENLMNVYRSVLQR